MDFTQDWNQNLLSLNSHFTTLPLNFLNTNITISYPNESKAKVAFGVNSTTLRRRCKGTQVSKSKARQAQQLLTAGEEEAVVDWCGRMCDL